MKTKPTNQVKLSEHLPAFLLPLMKHGKAAVIALLFLLSGFSLYAQPGAHDPSRMIRNTDGRYWIFTTGNGIYAMSSSNANFTDWRAEPTPFGNSWPSWISNYVSGFNGNFWAPDVVKIGSYYYLYYSCAGTGAPAAIGVTRATNLAGPWTDLGMVVAGNNAIDPAILVDGTNMWMTWGNWQTGIDIVQLSQSTGKRLNSSMTHLVSGEVEGPALLKNGSYYYLFYQRGLCCSGVNSTYYIVVARSTSPTGPYTGERVFLPNRNGNIIGPGHIGYGEGKLTYHYYDGASNGTPRLFINTLSWASDGWPVAGGTSTGTQPIANGTYRLKNRASGKYLDNMGATTDGATVAQWAGGTSNNQRWVVTYSGGYYKLACKTGGKYLDNIGNTADGSSVGQWTSSPNYAQQWTISATGSYFKVINRANGKSLDSGGSTADGGVMQFWPSNTSNNQQWSFEQVSTSTTLASPEANALKFYQEPAVEDSERFTVSPNPVTDNLLTLSAYLKLKSNVKISVTNVSGQLVYSENLGVKEAGDLKYDINVSAFSKGLYVVNLVTESGTRSFKVIRN